MPRPVTHAFALTACILLITACGPSAPAATATSVPLPTKPPPTSAPPTEAPPTLTPEPTFTPLPTPTPVPWFRDDFDAELGEGWSWLREQPDRWSLSKNPGFLTMTLVTSGRLRNLLLHEALSPNFEITTFMSFTPKSNFQIAGLLVYDSDQTFAVFGRAFCNTPNACQGNAIYFDATQDGKYAGINFARAVPNQDQAYLRLVKIGTTITGSYSEDGYTWTTFGEHYLSMSAPKVGLIAGQSNVAGAEAKFDFFEYLGLP